MFQIQFSKAFVVFCIYSSIKNICYNCGRLRWVLLGDFDDALRSLVQDCDKQNVPCLFALSRRSLGGACAKPVPISVLGIVSCTGVEVPPAAQLLYCMKASK